MGGGVALCTALERPARVSRLALIDSHGLGGAVPRGVLRVPVHPATERIATPVGAARTESTTGRAESPGHRRRSGVDHRGTGRRRCTGGPTPQDRSSVRGVPTFGGRTARAPDGLSGPATRPFGSDSPDTRRVGPVGSHLVGCAGGDAHPRCRGPDSPAVWTLASARTPGSNGRTPAVVSGRRACVVTTRRRR